MTDNSDMVLAQSKKDLFKIIEIIEDDGMVGYSPTEVLGNISVEKAIKLLITALEDNDEDESVR